MRSPTGGVSGAGGAGAAGAARSGARARVPGVRGAPALRKGEAERIPDEVRFGREPAGAGARRLAFGSAEDPDELGGEYWLESYSEDDAPSEELVLVGCVIRNAAPEQVAAVRLAVRAMPVLSRAQAEAGLDLAFALEVADDLAGASALRALAPAGPGVAKDDGEQLFVQVGDRMVDVVASLRTNYQRFRDTSGEVPKTSLAALLASLDLLLSEEELAEAALPFRNTHISFEQFKAWWIS